MLPAKSKPLPAPSRRTLRTRPRRTALKRARLVAVGKGESKPAVANDSPDNIQTNRRVVARVLSQE